MIPAALVTKDRTLLATVQTKAVDAVTAVMPDVSRLSRNETGGVFRKIATGTADQFGAAAVVAATYSYGEMRDAVVPTAKKLNLRPVFTLDMDGVDNAIGFSLSRFVDGDPAGAARQLAASVGLVVANQYRASMMSNSRSDSAATGYQRVANGDACAFCAYAAATANVTTATDFEYHDHCSCTTVPVFKGSKPFRPDYYSDYEDAAWVATNDIRKNYDATYSKWLESRPSGERVTRKQFFAAHPETAVTTKNILAGMRAQGYR